MSGEYISREYLGLTDFEIIMCNGDYKAGMKILLEKIEKAPAADVVAVRHGRWIEIEHGENGILCECSTCKEWMLFYYGFVANYCPPCGAKMDGGQGDG